MDIINLMIAFGTAVAVNNKIMRRFATAPAGARNKTLYGND